MGALPRLLDATPSFVRRLALVELFRVTASAFQREMPDLRGLSREQCLQAYARATAEWGGEAVCRKDDLQALEARLYGNARRLGRVARRLCGIRSLDGVAAAARFLYGILDIDLMATGSGEITIRACYFGRCYSPDICRLMSAMDGGLFAGLAHGGVLTFTERITEGQAGCRARFIAGQQPKKEQLT